VIHIFDWKENWVRNDEAWLVLGKGPTFSLRDRIDLREFTTVSLNHAVVAQPVDIAHAIDIDVFDDCSEILQQNAKWLLMPLYPHVRCKPSGLSLPDFFQSLPILQHFEQSGRLLWYDLWSGPKNHRRPIAKGTFSASVVMNLLGQLGVKQVKTLGVDGGTSYNPTFSNRTLFLNGHSSFDVQFQEIDKTVVEYKMNVQKVVEPIRIFVGCDDSQLVAGKVLEYSIKKHTQHPVEVFFMNNMPVPPPKHKKNRPGTGFSFNRFLIPKLAGYRGKAIYIDADMLVFDDIEKLWDIPMGNHKVLCSVQSETPKGWEGGQNNDLGEGRYWTPGRQMSVMLMDCENLDWDIDEIIRGLDEERYGYKDLMAKFCILDESDIGDSIPNTWNCLEWFEEGKSQLVHFTVVPTQPWKNDRNALDAMWTDAFREAYCAGAVPIKLIEESVSRKLIKPSLLELAQSCEVSTPTKQESTPLDEATRLRRMLWDTMISDYTHRTQAKTTGSSLGWTLENFLIRKPMINSLRVARFAARKAKRAFRKVQK
tara:strand:- start:10039 stop:11649 length:1611 start_codon:yes stop_codon:yes gene_type:complete